MSDEKQESYLIGIDLGTTNCTVSYTNLSSNDHVKGSVAEIHTMQISQLIGASLQAEKLQLPSFLYLPVEEEKEAGQIAIDWDPSRAFCVGTYARDRGSEMPHRVISSAKSWLACEGVNRRDAILPLDLEDKQKKMSPVQVCSEYLRHIAEVWNQQFPDAPFVEQNILVTVPASFDPDARQLVQEAAELAKYPDILLLEEPQAAFYAWLHRHHETWREKLHVGDQVLVVDLGGGTCDFSLISVEEEEGDLQLKREAVGAHLLLGGDNMDLTLAYTVRNQLEDEGHSIDDWQMGSLIHSCREAKERFLGEDAPDSIDIHLQGRGSGLIASSIQTQIHKDDVLKVLVDGFMPLVDATDRSKSSKKSALQTVALPYAEDPRISCQLAKFLSMTGESDSDSMDQFILPNAVLFTGGTMKSSALRERVMSLLGQWAEKMEKGSVVELPDPDYDFSVSCGAVYYGLAREGKAVRIKSGTSRSYYIGVEDARPAIPGVPPSVRAVCVAPFGMEEGTECELSDQEFTLLLGEQASFRFFSRNTATLSDGSEAEAGTVVRKWKQELSELHSIDAVMDKEEGDGKTARVHLKAKVTELGVLELWCIGENGRKWKMEFELRQAEAELTEV
ncbi:MAG: molecular chaperone DnaK [Waddliaceae bacterium]|nr:molecular chaperone DnaK [Waddliaceae bacterium]